MQSAKLQGCSRFGRQCQRSKGRIGCDVQTMRGKNRIPNGPKMIAEVHQTRLSRFRRNYRDAVTRDVRFGGFGQRQKIADWCVENWPDKSYLTRYRIREELRQKYRQEFGVIWATILSALLSAVISALINHWFSDNVRLGL